MEQKRILWITAAVGIFLLVVVGFTLILYAPPQSNVDPVIAFSQAQNDTWVNPQVVAPSTEQKTPAQTEPNVLDQVSTLDPTTNAITVDTTVVNATASVPLPSTLQTNDLTVISNGSTTVYAADGITTIDLAVTTEAKVVQDPTPSTNITQSEKTVPSVTERLPSISSPEPKTITSPAPKATTTSPKKTASTPEVKSAPAKAKKSVATLAVPKASLAQYWVQAASFISKANAEAARTSLSDEKIPAEVFTYVDETGITYYRLRVGPYTTKSEAEYWNSRIKLIDNFGSTQSYVTNSTAPQV